VLLMTAFGDVDKAVAAMRGGACDFLLKPFEPNVLLEHVARYAVRAAGRRRDRRRPAHPQLAAAGRARGRNRCHGAAHRRIRHRQGGLRALHPRPVGARRRPFRRHQLRGDSRQPARSHPVRLREGCLHRRPGAQAGKFEQAKGGTLLLDEISEMPLGLQAKLLRVLQEREVERVGGKKPVALDIRVLATSNRDMARRWRPGVSAKTCITASTCFRSRFRPCAERPGDILPLARHCLARQAAAARRTARFAAAAEARLAAHAWPGNVRELENVVQRALIAFAESPVSAWPRPT
jgi:two-component system response regulator FlrC